MQIDFFFCILMKNVHQSNTMCFLSDRTQSNKFDHIFVHTCFYFCKWSSCWLSSIGDIHWSSYAMVWISVLWYPNHDGIELSILVSPENLDGADSTGFGSMGMITSMISSSVSSSSITYTSGRSVISNSTVLLLLGRLRKKSHRDWKTDFFGSVGVDDFSAASDSIFDSLLVFSSPFFSFVFSASFLLSFSSSPFTWTNCFSDAGADVGRAVVGAGVGAGVGSGVGSGVGTGVGAGVGAVVNVSTSFAFGSVVVISCLAASSFVASLLVMVDRFSSVGAAEIFLMRKREENYKYRIKLRIQTRYLLINKN